jgi:hypothetical protein
MHGARGETGHHAGETAALPASCLGGAPAWQRRPRRWRLARDGGSGWGRRRLVALSGRTAGWRCRVRRKRRHCGGAGSGRVGVQRYEQGTDAEWTQAEAGRRTASPSMEGGSDSGVAVLTASDSSTSRSYSGRNQAARWSSTLSERQKGTARPAALRATARAARLPGGSGQRRLGALEVSCSRQRLHRARRRR